jgi:electron transport complex protein RnfC
MKTFSLGGVHPNDSKISANAAIENFPIPEVAYISMGQHLGAPAEPIVAAGDKVKVGQLIANANGFISAPVHSSVSGTVKGIETIKDLAGNPCKAVVITVEGDEWVDTIDRSDKIEKEIKLEAKEIIEKIKECGVVGLGGATFPTNVKLSPPPGKKAEFLIINGAECEPYLTSDYRVLIEMPEQVLIGAAIMMKALNVTKGFIGCERIA